LEIGGMLGRSASWISNRVALAVRLDNGVREMLARRLLDARSAQEIARLPEGVQHEFADRAVRDGLPKTSIEALVAGYNADGCPDAVKSQIVSDPRAALARMTDGRRAVEDAKPAMRKPGKGPQSIGLCIEAVKMPLAWLAAALYKASAAEASPHREAMKGLENDILALLDIIRGLISPGKKPAGKGGAAYGN